MREFAQRTDDILSHIADTLRPQSIKELAEIEFGEREDIDQ